VRLFRSLLVFVAALAAVCAGPIVAVQATVLRLSWSSIGAASSVVTDGNYVFINNPDYPPGGNHPTGQPLGSFSGGVLINEQTGMRRSVPRSGCFAIAVSAGRWVLFDCYRSSAGNYQLYSIPRRSWRSVAAPARANPRAIGAYWIEYFAVDSGTYVFQNIKTGTVRTLTAWRPGGTTIPDVNSPSLAGRLCSPLRVPADWTPYPHWSAYPYNEKLHAGWATVDGRFAVVQGTSRPTGTGELTGYAYVEQCGSRVRKPTRQGFVANAHAIIAPSGGSDPTFTGWLVPSLTPVTIPAPGYNQGVYGNDTSIALSSHSLYLWDSLDDALVAPSLLEGQTTLSGHAMLRSAG
jgi:hypothetical protein